jgi:hypothetical protein
MVRQADKRIDWRAKKGRDESRLTAILFAVFDQLRDDFEEVAGNRHGFSATTLPFFQI